MNDVHGYNFGMRANGGELLLLYIIQISWMAMVMKRFSDHAATELLENDKFSVDETDRKLEMIKIADKFRLDFLRNLSGKINRYRSN